MGDFAATGPVENIYKLSTALGIDVEKRTIDTLLDQGRTLAFTKVHADVTIAPGGNAVSRSSLDGMSQPAVTVKFSDAKLPLMAVLGGHPSKEYDATIVDADNAAVPEQAHLKFSMSIFGSDVKFHVNTSGPDLKVIDGTCKTKDGVTTIDETVKDGGGNLLVTGHIVTDMGKNPHAFHQSTELRDPKDHKLGTIEEDVKLSDDQLIADATIRR